MKDFEPAQAPPSPPDSLINVHENSCDTVAVVSGLDEPVHIFLPLSKFTYAKATDPLS